MSERFTKYRESIIFYFGVPVAIGFLLGWYSVYAAGDGSRLVGIFGWILHFEVYWVIGYVLIKSSEKVINSLNIHRAFQFLFVALVTSFLLRSLNWLIYALLVSSPEKSRVMPITPVGEITLFEPSLAFLWNMIVDYFPHSMLWLATCYVIMKFGSSLIFQFNGLHGPEVAASFGGDGANPEPNDQSYSSDKGKNNMRSHFIRQLKPELGTSILLLKAEGHYVQTITDKGKELVYYRFGDAIDQLTQNGIRVHRSFWISYTLLKSDETQVLDNEIVLKDYDNIPIGYSFRRQLKEYQKKTS